MNTENDYLFDDNENWGFSGNMSRSDQFSVILGNFVYVGCVIFPFYVIYILDVKSNQRYNNKYTKSSFDKFYSVLYEGLKP